MNKTFTFDSIVSSTYGLYITNGSVYNAPEREIDMYSIPGRNGDLAIDQGRYENIDVTYEVYSKKTSQTQFSDNIKNLRAALCSRYNYARLTDDYNTSEFRLGLYKSGLELNAPIDRAASIKVVFNCKPQRFLTSGETAQTFTAGGTISNPTLFASSPLIVVTGYGQLGIGSYTITIQGDDPTQKIYIDTDIMEAWGYESQVLVSKNDYIAYLNNAIPKLVPGSNSISLDTYISKVEITPRWWRI